MTRISEPWLFRAASAAASVYIGVSLQMGMSMRWLMLSAKGQMTFGSWTPSACVNGNFWIKMGVEFVETLTLC